MSKIDRITTDTTVCGGRPCIRGLRVRVAERRVELLGQGNRFGFTEVEELPELQGHVAQ